MTDGSRWTAARAARAARQRGAAIAEAIIALPILIVVILGAIQFGLIYEAKATLNHASLQAARAGAVSNATADSIRSGFARGLIPLHSPDSSLEGAARTLAQISAGLATDAQIRILNPTREAFEDFAEEVDGVREIPNDRLHTRSTAVGAQSGLSLQDANLLRVRVTYGYELKVPLVNWFISRVLLATGGFDTAFEQQLLRRSRLPILATATVRMQSPLRENGLLIAMADLPNADRIPADARPPDDVEGDEDDSQDDDDGQGGTGSDHEGSSLGEGFFGFGGGKPGAASSGEGDTEGTGNEGGGGGQPGSEGGGGNDGSGGEPLCTPVEAEPPAEGSGILDQVWDALQDLAGEAYDFAKGFWEGMKGQIGDLAAAIAHPIDTARGLYELARAFIDDPVGTTRMIGEALGTDLAKLAFCGSYDRGYVIGNNVSPAFMLKLATKLVKFGRTGLAAALDETKHELGCASFGATTAVWSGGRSVAIETLQAGDDVSSRSEQTYADQPQSITRTLSRSAPRYLEISTERGSLRITEEHPVWVQGHGWKPIKDVDEGAPLATEFGDTLLLAKRPVEDSLQVFNFSVANTESYFVGDDHVWVHNTTCRVRVEYLRPRSPSNFQIGASDGGAGQWRQISRPDNDAYRYQERITGAPRGVEYNVNGVNFDGYDANRGVLLDAKHWTQECPLGDRCRFEPLKKGLANKLIIEARDQIDAVRNSNTPIEWRVVDEEMALRIGEILDSGVLNTVDRARISVIFTPISDIVD